MIAKLGLCNCSQYNTPPPPKKKKKKKKKKAISNGKKEICKLWRLSS